MAPESLKNAKRPFLSADKHANLTSGWRAGPPEIPHLQIRSERNLSAHRECVEAGARVSAVGRANLLGDVAMQVVEHETHVAIDVPVQTRRIDRLLSTGHAVCASQLIIQIHDADAAGNLPRAPAAAPYRERVCWDDAAIGGVGWNIRVGFAG